MNFELILFITVLITGVLTFVDVCYFAPKRRDAYIKKMPLIFDYARSFFPILFIVFFIRSFVVEPFYIPTPSLKPTLLEGDFVLVKKYSYDIQLPFLHKNLISVSDPKRGDIIVFRQPKHPSTLLIKRIIGIPGDHVSYKNKVLYINGMEMLLHFGAYVTDYFNGIDNYIAQNQERLFGIEHDIYQNPAIPSQDFEITVPPHNYFVMGDNRDNSNDSRDWGFLNKQNIIGKASRIWMSYDAFNHEIRWNRIGKKIH